MKKIILTEEKQVVSISDITEDSIVCVQFGNGMNEGVKSFMMKESYGNSRSWNLVSENDFQHKNSFGYNGSKTMNKLQLIGDIIKKGGDVYVFDSYIDAMKFMFQKNYTKQS